MKFEKEIEGLKIKDEVSFEYIYHETKYGVYSVINSIVKDEQLSEDLMQDTYIQMIKSIHSYNPQYKFITWLLTIAKNKALDEYRKKRRLVLVDVSNPEEEYILPSVKPDQDNQVLAETLLQVLDEEEKQVVIMYTIENLKHKDIALILDRPLGTVLWLYNKAIKKMRKINEGGQAK